jgi:hypothetical protein
MVENLFFTTLGWMDTLVCHEVMRQILNVIQTPTEYLSPAPSLGAEFRRKYSRLCCL